MIGRLKINQDKRWEIVNDLGDRVLITAGDVIEVKLGNQWFKTSVEYIYEVGYQATKPGLSLFVGQQARIRFFQGF